MVAFDRDFYFPFQKHIYRLLESDYALTIRVFIWLFFSLVVVNLLLRLANS